MTQRATPHPHPTDAELRILQVLWRDGPSTVREVHEALERLHGTDTGYTTTLKLLQNMHEKGIVHRDDAGRSHVYRAAVSEEATQRRAAGELLDRLFGGSAAKLVMHALAAKRAAPHELEEIRHLLDKMEGRRKP